MPRQRSDRRSATRTSPTWEETSVGKIRNSWRCHTRQGSLGCWLWSRHGRIQAETTASTGMYEEKIIKNTFVFAEHLTGLVTDLFFKDYGRGIKMCQKLYFDGVSHGSRSQKYHFGHPSQHHCWDCKMAGDRHWFWAFLSKQINQLFVESQHSALYWHDPLFMVNILA